MRSKKNMTEFTESLENKNIVADTSSLLAAGTDLLTYLSNTTLIIPAIVVSELEDKRSHATLGYLAREWLRFLEELRKKHGNALIGKVKIIGYNNLYLKIEPNHSMQESLPIHLRNGKNDSTILAVAANLANENPDEEVVILSNDTPMRLHATLDLKMQAYEYNTTLAKGVNPFDGEIVIEIDNDEYLESEMVLKNGTPLLDLVDEKLEYLAESSHAYVKVKIENEAKILSTFIYSNGLLTQLGKNKKTASGITARTLEQDIAMTYLKQSAEELPIVSINGKAGTGKTAISVAVAIEEAIRENYQKIIVFRSLHEMGNGQELGFLPGDVDEKMAAWAGAVYDAIDVIAANLCKKTSSAKKTNANEVKEKAKVLRDMIEVSPITYLRGRSLSNSFIILDEAQNFSRFELLNILTRAGEGTKIVLLSDANQVDNRFLQSGSKADIWSVIENLKSESLFAHITLNKTERSKVAEIASNLLEQ